MGAWSSTLYGNDTSCDVRDTYMGYLKEQMSNADAFQQIMQKFEEYMGGEEEPFFWYALADTQWRTGRLLPEVKKKALYWIEQTGE